MIFYPPRKSIARLTARAGCPYPWPHPTSPTNHLTSCGRVYESDTISALDLNYVPFLLNHKLK